MNIDPSDATEQHHRPGSPGGYALYRLPDARNFVYTAQHDAPDTVASFAALEGRRGVVIAPFHPTPDTPAVLIRPDILVTCPLPPSGEGLQMTGLPLHAAADTPQGEGREAYAEGFAVCKRRLADGAVRKVVYARRESLALPAGPQYRPLRLFLEACRHHPHSYVSLWHTPQTGCWLVASPETLLAADDADHQRWHTMALAGTMPLTPEALCTGNWSAKDKAEQAFVTEFIKHQLTGIASDISLSEVYPSPAANVVHLRTDFGFRLKNGIGLGTLLDRLHPTPAVCGSPRAAAFDAINAAEAVPRRYYAGFSGPLSLHGNTRFYVSIRCMELFSDQARLYAGGGLLPASVEETEWEETCRKLRAMKDLFRR